VTHCRQPLSRILLQERHAALPSSAAAPFPAAVRELRRISAAGLSFAEIRNLTPNFFLYLGAEGAQAVLTASPLTESASFTREAVASSAFWRFADVAVKSRRRRSPSSN